MTCLDVEAEPFAGKPLDLITGETLKHKSIREDDEDQVSEVLAADAAVEILPGRSLDSILLYSCHVLNLLTVN